MLVQIAMGDDVHHVGVEPLHRLREATGAGVLEQAEIDRDPALECPQEPDELGTRADVGVGVVEVGADREQDLGRPGDLAQLGVVARRPDDAGDRDGSQRVQRQESLAVVHELPGEPAQDGAVVLTAQREVEHAVVGPRSRRWPPTSRRRSAL